MVVHIPVGIKPLDCVPNVVEYVPNRYEMSTSARTRTHWRIGFMKDLDLPPSEVRFSPPPASSLLPSLLIGAYVPRLNLVKKSWSFADILRRYKEVSEEHPSTYHSAKPFITPPANIGFANP